MVVLVAAQFCRFVNKEEYLLCLNQRSSFDQGNGVYWANNVPPLRQRSCPRRLIWFYIFRARVTLWLWLTFYGCIKDTGQQEQQKMGLLTNAVKHFKHCRWDKNLFCRRKLFGSLAMYLDVNISYVIVLWLFTVCQSHICVSNNYKPFAEPHPYTFTLTLSWHIGQLCLGMACSNKIWQ